MRKNLLKYFIFFSLSISSISSLYSQSSISGFVKGLDNGDSAIITVQKSTEAFYFKKIGGNSTKSDIPFNFPGLANGKWALSIDAKGYLFPVAKVLELNNNTLENVITLTKSPDSNFTYQWQDDSSYVGHAQQSYVNDSIEITVLGVAEKIPDNFNGINLLYEYGFLLSDAITPWTNEDAFRLLNTIKRLNFRKFGERDSVVVNAVWRITDEYIDKDISFAKKGSVDEITISRKAFTYATPLVVTLDGLKGKFFSKRLYNAAVYYYTDKGTLGYKIDEIAKTRYGFDFLVPSEFLRNLMGETETNFQQFTPDEKLIILSMFEEFPDGMQRQDQLKYMVRRINGQPHPRYPTAPAIAWVTNQNIEWMETAFKSQDITYMQRLVLHEKAHFLWEHTFDSTTKNDWAVLGGWFLDPTSSTGWTTSNTTEFVSAYAHAKNPNEDMAESIAFYITNPDALRSRSLKKFEFVRDRLMKGTRYVSQIRPDLTFKVYNLYPDYFYPGKIIRTKLDVIGKAEEDKKIILEIELKDSDTTFGGAEQAWTTIYSPIGTFIGMSLSPVNSRKTILRGERVISKLSKSGYWNIPQIVIIDQARNTRLENSSTYGIKCFVNNPLEDVTPPLYVQNTLKLDTLTDKFLDFRGIPASKVCGSCADTLKPMKALRIKADIIEKNTIGPYGRIYFNINFPTIDSTDKYNPRPYSMPTAADQGSGLINDVKDSLKRVDILFPIRDFYPSGYYSIPFFSMEDHALNIRGVFLDKDTANKNFFMTPPNQANQRALRDSIYIQTPYPDYKPPVLDLNDITIKATPSIPEAPNGETLFEMWLWIKDESDFPGKASGLKHGWYRLRDPQGLEREISMQKDLGNLFYQFTPDSSIYGFKRYYFSTLLPAGSPPGLWGVSAIILEDHALNKRSYGFTEIVRFDVDQSKVLQVNPFVEINGKKVNLSNVDSVGVTIGCKSCQGQNYRLRVYSSMGGNSIVFEGKMPSDTFKLSNLKLTGVNDGILYASVFILDSTKALIGTGRASFTKDTQIPKSQQLQTNLNNFGKSNLDSLIVEIKTSEIKGSYTLVVVQKTISSGGTRISGLDPTLTSAPNKYSAEGDSIVLTGTFQEGLFKIPFTSIRSMKDGLIELKFYLVDSVGNAGEVVTKSIYKDTKDPVITFKKISEKGLDIVMSMSSNEFISNAIVPSELNVKNSKVLSVDKVDSRNFLITLNRICNDTFGISLKSASLFDTVGNGNSASSLQFIDIITPIQPIVSALSICQGIISSPLSAQALSGNTLRWYDTLALGGNYSANANIPYANREGSFYYYVSQVNTSTGCESPRAKITVSVKPAPAAPIVENVNYCQNNTAIPLSATSLTNHILNWYDSLTGGTPSLTPMTPSTNSVGSRNFYVSQKNTTTHCEGPRSSIKVTVYPIPPTPTISRDAEGNLVSSSSDGNQWYKEGVSISGASGQLFKPKEPGNYAVKITRNDCSGSISTSYYYLATTISNFSYGEFIRVSPNPIKNIGRLDFSLINTTAVDIEILDVFGRKIIAKSSLQSGKALELESLQTGFYTLRVINKTSRKYYSVQLIKL